MNWLDDDSMCAVMGRNPQAVVGFVRQIRTDPAWANVAVVFVEGTTDQAALSSILSERPRCVVVPAHSKHNVVAAASLAARDSVPGILGARDADFDRLLERLAGEVPDLPVVVIEPHDLETMLLSRGIIDDMLGNRDYVSGETEDYLRAAYSPSIERRLLDTVAAVEAALLLKESENIADALRRRLGLPELRHARSLRIETSTIPWTELVGMTSAVSRNALVATTLTELAGSPRPDEGELLAAIETVVEMLSERWLLARGHDLAAALAAMISSAPGAPHLNGRQVEDALRALCNTRHFRGTHVYAQMVIWERDHPGFTVLRP